MKVCTKCKIPKDLVEFGPDRRRSDDHKSWCKGCCNQDSQDYYRNRGGCEVKKKYDLEYNKKNSDRLKKKRSDNTKAWKEYFSKIYNDPPKCQICGLELHWYGAKNSLVHFDHCNGSNHNIGVVYNWIGNNYCTKENQKKFRSENFGILCGYCNASLPTNLIRRKAIVQYLLGD